MYKQHNNPDHFLQYFEESVEKYSATWKQLCILGDYNLDQDRAGIQDKAYILVNIYAPNKDKVSGKLYKNLHRVLQTKDLDCEENIIIGVDFKCPLDPKLDKKGGVNIVS